MAFSQHNAMIKSSSPQNIFTHKNSDEELRYDPVPQSQTRFIETVKEDPAMSESMILATKPIEEIRRQFPIQGLAKRMSIAASDLIGKSHGELILLLIQLNREKSNLQHMYDYNKIILKKQTEEYDKTASSEQRKMIELRVNKSLDDISDIEYQLELGQPLITFIDNIVKLSSLYGGDDLMFATEYRSHLLHSDEMRPLRDNVNFMRKIQERSVSKEVNEESESEHPGNNDAKNDDTFQLAESSEFKKTFKQLETELNNFTELNQRHHSKKQDLMQYINRVQSIGLRSSNSQNNKVEKNESYMETDLDTKRMLDLAAKYPRRMDRHSLRRSNTLNLHQQSTMLNKYDEKNRGYQTLPERWNSGRKSLSSNREHSSNLYQQNYRLSSSSSILPDDVFVDTDVNRSQNLNLYVPNLKGYANGRPSTPSALLKNDSFQKRKTENGTSSKARK